MTVCTSYKPVRTLMTAWTLPGEQLMKIRENTYDNPEECVSECLIKGLNLHGLLLQAFDKKNPISRKHIHFASLFLMTHWYLWEVQCKSILTDYIVKHCISAMLMLLFTSWFIFSCSKWYFSPIWGRWVDGKFPATAKTLKENHIIMIIKIPYLFSWVCPW